MTDSPLRPGSKAPTDTLPVLSGGERSLFVPRDGYDWMLAVVYRGKHCPLCTGYLKQWDAKLDELKELGVDFLALSSDSKERAEAQIAEVDPKYDVAYGLSVDQMKAFGLYVSGPRNGMDVEGPFAEPGLYVINEKGEVLIMDTSNVPFARPEPARILAGIRYLKGLEQEFPINGTHA